MSFRLDCPSPSLSKHPFLSSVELPQSFSQESAPLDVVQSPSGFDQVSESESTHPNRSEVDVPERETHPSGDCPEGLSPYPSPSVSTHCVASFGKSSPVLDHPSPSVSGHPLQVIS
jgi:hypothetical protein